MLKTIHTSVKKCIKSFSFAKRGLLHVIINENNFNYHMLATLIVVIAGIMFQLSINEWIILIILIGIVYTAEVFNTAIEKLVDLISLDYNQKAGLIKDISAAGVLVASIIAAISGLMLFTGKLFQLNLI